MASTPTTRWQVNGYRFLVRRMEHALVRRDVRMLHDPMKSQSRALLVGVVIASLGLAACGALALFRPQDKIGNASIVVGKSSGAMYVVMGDTLRPVLNLASARLILGEAADPVIVKESELSTRSRGALVGIPGAPSALPQTAAGANIPWSVCDSIAPDGNRSITTSVVVGEAELGEGISTLAPEEALLLETDDKAYLVYDGKRAEIDLKDSAITRALGIEDLEPRPVSTGLLNGIPEVPAIIAPEVPGLGDRPNFNLQGKTIGSVFQVVIGTETQHYLVLKVGVQKISAAVAQLIFASDPQGDESMSSVTLSALKGIDSTIGISVSTFPENPPKVVTADDSPVSCLSWTPLGDGSDNAGGIGASVTLVAGRTLPVADDARMVKLAQADGAGDNADSVYVKPGSSGFFQSTGIEPDSTRRDSVFYVADTGVRFGVKDEESGKALGMSDRQPDRAPWAILGLLAPGPSLGKEEALIAHDGMAPDPNPASAASGK